jgi:molecular chaperone HtpG
MIGQFGVGFYSAFLVADSVTVCSKKAGSGEAWIWQSQAKGDYEVRLGERESRGTDITLHIKDDAKEYLEEWSVQSVVRKYSDYVRWPIRMQVERGEDKDTRTEWQTINQARALWTRSKSEVTKDQYVEFYKHTSHDWNDPLAWTHFKVEGTHELTGLLFVPEKAPHDLTDRKKGGVLQFGTEVVTSADGSISGLLGASPGASTAVYVMLQVLERSFAKDFDGWQSKLKQIIPSFGTKLSSDPAKAAASLAATAKTLKIK